MGSSLFLGSNGGGPGPPGPAAVYSKFSKVLNAADILAQAVIVPGAAITNSMEMYVGDSNMKEGTDYTLAPSGPNTQVTFINELATGGATALIVGDEVRFDYAI
jgi:hypothetical protein